MLGDLLLRGPAPELLAELNVDFSRFPPWICMFLACVIDAITYPIGCQSLWRHYAPLGLADTGNWFAEEFNVRDIFEKFEPEYLTFGKFRIENGYGSDGHIFEGIESLQDAKEWMGSLYQYMFQTPETLLTKMMAPETLAVVFVLVLAFRAVKSVLMPWFREIGRQCALRYHGKDWLKAKANQERIEKFGEYVFRLLYHSAVSLYGFYYFWSAPWWNEDQGGTVNLWIGFPAAYQIQPWMIWYYLVQGAYNAEAAIGLLEQSFQVRIFPKYSYLPITIEWADTVRSDFAEMTVHHVLTNALILLSSWARMQRIGSMVFWMHDISDIPVDLAKLANFLKWRTATAAAFFTLCGVWIVTRLYIFPCIIWSTCYRESIAILGYISDAEKYYYLFTPLFLSLLGGLIILHYFWFSMFIRMGYILVTTGMAKDYTEKSENAKLKSNGHRRQPKRNISVTGDRKDS